MSVHAVVPVRVAYNDVIETDTEVLAWTPGGAVLIRYTSEGDRFAEYVWLWANAIRRIGHAAPTSDTPRHTGADTAGCG